MIKLMKKKIKQKNGESIVETLVAMLIIVLAMGLLSTSVVASARINAVNREMDKKFDQDLMNAETHQSDAENPAKDIDLIITFTEGDPKKVTGILYGGTTGVFASYDYEAGVITP